MNTQNKKLQQKAAQSSTVNKTTGVKSNTWINNVMRSDDAVEEAKNWVDFNEL